MSPETQQYGPGLATGYRRGAADPAPAPDQHNGAPYEVPADKPRLPSLDLEAPAEPDLGDDGWLAGGAGTLADHPLLRGLLMELPPKGSTPPPGWLDRWFEATRSILELLYVHDGAAGARR